MIRLFPIIRCLMLIVEGASVSYMRLSYKDSSRRWCMGRRQLRGSICLLQTRLLHLVPGRSYLNPSH